MSAGNRDEYRRTVFDRHGPEAAQLVQTVSSLAIPIVAGALVGGALAARNGFSPALIVVSMFGASLVFAVCWWHFVTMLSYNARARIHAADLYAKSGMRERAELLYHAAQRLPRAASSDDIYASNRLVDLYLAWPGHETKGLRELRRLIDTYPETDVAARARAGLVNLKGQLGIAE